MKNNLMQKEAAAPYASVGADAGQPTSNNTVDSILQFPANFNPGPKFSENNLPPEIVRNGLFCTWRYENRNGRRTKVPYNPLSGQPARSNDRSSFTTFEKAAAATDYDGIGLGIFDGICAIDLDHCISDSGFYSAAAAEIVALMHTYTEISPGGDGLHILFQAEGFQYDTNRWYIMNHGAGIEVYVAGVTSKYVTVTANRCEEYPYGDRSKELEMLLNRFMRRSEKSAINTIITINSDGTPDPESFSRNLEDEDLIRLAENSRNGAAFSALWSGSIAGYPSHSEADMALCSSLAFWTGRDADRMDRLFRQSGLMRDKWDRRQAGTTYGRITIQKAIANCREVYTSSCAGQSRPAKESQNFPPIVPLTPLCGSLPQFPADALPDTMQQYVCAVAEQTQTFPDMAAVIGLGVLAVCLQGKFRIEGIPGYTEPLSLYTVVIAPPGERKSGVMRAMTASLYEYEQEYNRAHADEVRANRRERERLERQIAGLKKKLETRIDREAELELQHLEHQLEDLPELHSARYFADDCSSEALTRLMAANGGVLSVISTEGGIFDILGGRYSAKVNLDVWLKGHCGDAIYVDRIGREAECIPNPTLSAILTIQPSVLNEIMEDTTMTGRGLIARFLYASPASAIGRRKFRSEPVSPAVKSAYRDLVFRLMAIPLPEEPGTLTLSEEALEVISDHFDEHERWLTGEGQAIADWASKYIGAVLRIAGLLHASETGCEARKVSADTMRRAIRIGQYFLAHAGYAYSVMGTDQNVRKAKFVLAKLGTFNRLEVKRAELFQLCRGKFFRKAEDMSPTLELLEEHGYLKQEIPERKGPGRRPDVRIMLNPAASTG